jgi:hypothetical protein
MNLIIILLLICCCCCIILSGGYFYITNSSNKNTSELSPNIPGKSTSVQSSSTLVQPQSTLEQPQSISDQSSNKSDQLQTTTTIKPTTTTTPPPVIKWVICGKDNAEIPTIGYSYDGKIWKQVKSIISISGMFNSVAYNGTLWVAVGQARTILIATSTDGIDWKLNNFSNQYNGSGYSICWTGSMWVIAGSTTQPSTGWSIAAIITSTDGLNWSQAYNSNNGNTYFSSVAYNPSIKTLVASGGNFTAYSKDGINWTSIHSSAITDNGIMKMTIINSQFVAAVMSNQANLINSTDGITWNRYNNIIQHSVMSNPNKISFFNNTMIAGGFGHFQLAYSSDQGKTWIGSVKSFNADYSSNVINDITTNNSDIVLAVGYDRNRAGAKMVGQVLTSTDGIKWSLPNLITFMSSITSIASNIPL